MVTPSENVVLCLLSLCLLLAQASSARLQRLETWRKIPSGALRSNHAKVAIPVMEPEVDTQAKSRGASCSNCGVKFPAGSRIIEGEETGVNEWPWQVYLEIATNNQTFMCGGSLYKTRYIITAAHCLENDPVSVRVFTGDHLLSTLDEPEETEFSAESFVIHGRYGSNPQNSMENDIAILKLFNRVTFTDRVRPICLPKREDNFNGMTAWVTGWGQTESGQTSDFLRETSITLSSDQECEKLSLSKKIVCGLGKRNGKLTDACMGDSGGPLVVHVRGRWVLAGVVSYGISGCAVEGEPGMYTKVSRYLSWIRTHTKGGKC